jgi:hypothetical protein
MSKAFADVVVLRRPRGDVEVAVISVTVEPAER